MRSIRSSAALIVALLAFVLALSGGAYALGRSDGDTLIKKNSLSGNRLKNDTVAGTKIKDPTLFSYNYGSGWTTNTGFTARPAGFRKDASGFVHLQGAATRTSGTGSTIATLPAGFRPTDYTYFPVYTEGNTIGSIYIASNGEITLFGGNAGFVSLDGVTFYPDR